MSERLDFKGDYMGFTYNGKHSSDLGIVRVSSGSRFNENLLPTMQDKTAQVPGGDGTYYFGSYYTQRQFTVNFAFDSLTEQQIQELRNHFGDKGIHDLIFDETPYKAYSAKVTGTATIKYLAFNEGDTGRVYKGEGSLQFTCYNPYARSVFKFKTTSLEKAYPNWKEWEKASGIRSREDFDKNKEGKYKLYNPGVKESDFLFVFQSVPKKGSISLRDQNNMIIKQLSWDGLEKKTGEDGFVFDSKLGLIRGAIATASSGFYKNYVLTQTIYNDCITEGEFFKIPVTIAEYNDAPAFVLANQNNAPIIVDDNQGLIYDYYYL